MRAPLQEPLTAPLALVGSARRGRRTLLDMLLSARGYQIAACEDGPSVLEFLKENQPDIAIFDHDLPGMDGREICSRMRFIARLADTPVAIVTPTVEEMGGSAGFENFAETTTADIVEAEPLGKKNLIERLEGVIRDQRGAANAGKMTIAIPTVVPPIPFEHQPASDADTRSFLLDDDQDFEIDYLPAHPDRLEPAASSVEPEFAHATGAASYGETAGEILALGMNTDPRESDAGEPPAEETERSAREDRRDFTNDDLVEAENEPVFEEFDTELMAVVPSADDEEYLDFLAEERGEEAEALPESPTEATGPESAADEEFYEDERELVEVVKGSGIWRETTRSRSVSGDSDASRISSEGVQPYATDDERRNLGYYEASDDDGDEMGQERYERPFHSELAEEIAAEIEATVFGLRSEEEYEDDYYLEARGRTARGSVDEATEPTPAAEAQEEAVVQDQQPQLDANPVMQQEEGVVQEQQPELYANPVMQQTTAAEHEAIAELDYAALAAEEMAIGRLGASESIGSLEDRGFEGEDDSAAVSQLKDHASQATRAEMDSPETGADYREEGESAVLNDERANMQALIDEQAERIANLQQRNVMLRQELEQRKAEDEQREDERSNLQALIKEQTEAISNLQQRNVQLRQELETLKAAEARRQSERTDLQTQTAEQAEMIAKLQQLNALLREELEQRKADEAPLRDFLQRLLERDQQSSTYDALRGEIIRLGRRES